MPSYHYCTFMYCTVYHKKHVLRGSPKVEVIKTHLLGFPIVAYFRSKCTTAPSQFLEFGWDWLTVFWSESYSPMLFWWIHWDHRGGERKYTMHYCTDGHRYGKEYFGFSFDLYQWTKHFSIERWTPKYSDCAFKLITKIASIKEGKCSILHKPFFQYYYFLLPAHKWTKLIHAIYFSHFPWNKVVHLP